MSTNFRLNLMSYKEMVLEGWWSKEPAESSLDDLHYCQLQIGFERVAVEGGQQEETMGG